MRTQVKIVACASQGKLTATVLGLKNYNWKVGSVLIKLSIASHKRLISAHTIEVQAPAKEVTLHETVTFNLTTSARNRRLLIEVWSSSATPANFLGCTSFGIRKLTDLSAVIQGYFYLLSRGVGYQKHLAVKPSRQSDYANHSRGSSQMQKRVRNNGLDRDLHHRRILEHKELQVPSSLLQQVTFEYSVRTPPTVAGFNSDPGSYDLRKSDTVLAVNSTLVTDHDATNFQNLLLALSGDVTLKIQRINSRKLHADKPTLTTEPRKRKLQRRQGLQRKRSRTIPKTSNQKLELESKSDSSGKNELLNRLSAIGGHEDYIRFCGSSDDSANVDHPKYTVKTNRQVALSSERSQQAVPATKHSDSSDASNDSAHEYKMCTASFTYRKDLQKSAKIVRRRTIHNKTPTDRKTVDDSPTSPILRKNKGRRSFITREFGNAEHGKDDHDDRADLGNIGTLKSTYLSASEADLTKPKRYLSIRPTIRLPFISPKENKDLPNANQPPEHDKLKKLFRMRSRKLREDKVPHPNGVADNNNEGTSPNNKSLMNILKDKGKCATFRSFLAIEHSEENIAFWIDCESYKGKKPNKRRKAADAIVRKYMEIDGDNEVNITAQIRARVMKGLSSPTLDLFQEAQDYIYRLMESDPYRRFIKSSKS